MRAADNDTLPPAGARTDTVKPITLALQGGGSLGAFSWGALDRLLEESRLEIAVVSGTSAGAMNAAMLVQGLATGGRAEAKRLLEELWRRYALAWAVPPVTNPDWLTPIETVMAPVFKAVRLAANRMSRQQLNPLGLNPLRPVLQSLLDPSVFGRPGVPGLVVSATRLRSGQARLFRDAEVTVDALLASACLPDVFPAVELDGEGYWDGAFSCNPPIRALVEAGAPSDVLVIRTKAVDHPQPPRSSADIRDRMGEMAYGAALRQEVQSIVSAQQILADELREIPEGGRLGRLRRARLHVIGAEEEFRSLANASSRDTRWTFLREMHELGRASAEDWLATHFGSIGQRGTMDLSAFDLAPLNPFPAAQSAVS